MQSTQVGYPFQRIAIGILGGLPVTGRGNKYVLVISDYFTRWPEAIPMPSMTADTVARTVFDNVIYRFGCPDVIHSDQDSQFMSALLSIYVSYWTLTSPAPLATIPRSTDLLRD